MLPLELFALQKNLPLKTRAPPLDKLRVFLKINVGADRCVCLFAMAELILIDSSYFRGGKLCQKHDSKQA